MGCPSGGHRAAQVRAQLRQRATACSPRRCRGLGAYVQWVRSEPRIDARALRAARVAVGMSQDQLARVIGVAGGERISRWERGASTPRPEMVHRLAQALHVDPADLVAEGEARGLSRLRVAAGLSARDVAGEAHVSESTYRRWESGQVRRTPQQVTLELLARALQVSAEDVGREIAQDRHATAGP